MDELYEWIYGWVDSIDGYVDKCDTMFTFI